MSELAGRLAVIKASGDPVTAVAEGLTRIDDNTWQITDTLKQVLDRDTEPTLEQDDGLGGWDLIGYAKVNKLNGKFTFSDAGYAGTETIRIKTGNYLPMSNVAYAHDYTYNKQANLIEVNRFNETHKKRIVGTKFGSGSLSQWDVTDSYFEDVLTTGEPMVLELRASSSGDPQRLWALIESTEMSAALDSAQDEAVSFISTDELLKLGD